MRNPTANESALRILNVAANISKRHCKPLPEYNKGPPFGALVFRKPTGRERIQPTSIAVEGHQNGYVVDFKITQTFKHNFSTPREISYIITNNLKLCVYDTVFTIGDQVIRPEIHEKKDAEEIYTEAKDKGHAALLANNLPNGLVEFKLGNVAGDVVCKVDVRLCVMASSSGSQLTFVKFPLIVITPSSSTDCVLSDFKGDFTFKFTNTRPDQIRSIDANVRGEYKDGTWTLNEMPSQHAIILKTMYNSEISNLCHVEGNFMALSIFSQDPAFENTQHNNNEFIFVVDCSGSMRDNRIEKAREALGLFLRSLPVGSFFNIVRFGTTHSLLFKNSVPYNDRNLVKGLYLAKTMKADMGGTNIYDPLVQIFGLPVRSSSRQIFILTDGEVYNSDSVINLVRQNSHLNRCFTLGIGTGADPGLVEGIAEASHGSASFVSDSDDMNEKVIAQLEQSLSAPISDINVHIEGSHALEFADFPIHSIPKAVLTTILVKSTEPFQRGPILVTGKIGQADVDIPVDQSCTLSNRALSSLFAFASISNILSKQVITPEMREKCILLSKASGILCQYTSFVGVAEKVYVEKAMPVIPESMISTRTKVAPGGCVSCRTVKREPLCRALPDRECGAMYSSLESSDGECFDFFVGEPAPRTKSRDFASKYTVITSMQMLNGYWDDPTPLMEHITGKSFSLPKDVTEKFNNETRKRVTATVLALAILRVKFAANIGAWRMIQRKALSWLSSQNSSISWESTIDSVAAIVK